MGHSARRTSKRVLLAPKTVASTAQSVSYSPYPLPLAFLAFLPAGSAGHLARMACLRSPAPCYPVRLGLDWRRASSCREFFLHSASIRIFLAFRFVFVSILGNMFHWIVANLPPDPSGVLITILVCTGIGIGALTALIGAVHSKPTLSVLMLGAGAILGHVLPRRLGWTTNTAVTITIGGIVFGLAGFLLHRLCVALILALLAAGIAVAMLYDYHAPSELAGNSQPPAITSVDAAWKDAPAQFRSRAPWVALVTFVVFGAAGLIFPTFGMAALYSIVGTLLTLLSISVGHASDKITWLDSLKTGPMTVAVLGFAMLTVGFLTQLTLLNRPAETEPASARTKD